MDKIQCTHLRRELSYEKSALTFGCVVRLFGLVEVSFLWEIQWGEVYNVKTTTKTIMTLATLIYPRQCIYWYQRLLCPSKYRKKLIQMKYNKIKNPQWCEGRRIGYVHASMAEVLNSGARRSNSSLCEGLELATALATQSSAGYTPCCVGRPQSGAELQWETLLSRAASLLALDSIVTLQSSSPHSMMENRHFLVTGIRSKVSSFCWRSPFTSVSRRSLRRVNNPLNNGLDRIAGDYLF